MANKPDFDQQINFCALRVVDIVPDYVETTLELLDGLQKRIAHVANPTKLVVNFSSSEKVR